MNHSLKNLVSFKTVITALLFMSISVWGLAADAESQSVTTAKKAVKPGKNFSAAIEAGDYVFLSGAVGIGSEEQPIKGISAQTEEIMEQLKSTLADAGLKMSDVVKATVFIRNGDDFAAMNDVYRRYFPTDPPARSTLVTGFPNAQVLVEIEMIAYRGKLP